MKNPKIDKIIADKKGNMPEEFVYLSSDAYLQDSPDSRCTDWQADAFKIDPLDKNKILVGTCTWDFEGQFENPEQIQDAGDFGWENPKYYTGFTQYSELDGDEFQDFLTNEANK